MKHEPGELTFLRYAISVVKYCPSTPVQAREIEKFEKQLKNGGTPSRERLCQIFPDAVKHLKSWSHEDVQNYWLTQHNAIVGDNHACKVYQGQVREIHPPLGNEVNRVRVGRLDSILRSYIPLQQGEEVTTHAFAIAEKLTPEELLKYPLPRL